MADSVPASDTKAGEAEAEAEVEAKTAASSATTLSSYQRGDPANSTLCVHQQLSLTNATAPRFPEFVFVIGERKFINPPPGNRHWGVSKSVKLRSWNTALFGGGNPFAQSVCSLFATSKIVYLEAIPVFFRLKECIRLRRLSIELTRFTNNIARYPHCPAKPLGIRELLKLRGIRELEVNNAMPNSPTWFAWLHSSVLAFENAIQVLKEPRTKAQLTRPDEKDHAQGELVFGKVDASAA
ncbi:hypothetical protein OEA41_004327 [Lepraria neglecta]|uniref:Uncharacterized protein n=1 Tax=Lepraria neglecta TaxID=209136 RepID=A0AAD9YXP4_9LECA|nr:hypothetical protein OEA41_004327 [Lepraria neglecta]